MIAPFPAMQPFGAALWQKALRAMDVILHIGAHRCANTSFQAYLRANTEPLATAGIGFWGPIRTRSGLFRGIQPGPVIAPGRNARTRALGRVQLGCGEHARDGVETLVVCDQYMLGSMRANLRLADLYCGAGERMARFAEAFQGYLGGVVLTIRSPEHYWASLLACYASNGRGTPPPGLLQRVAESSRSWRDVITDIACAVPGIKVGVMPFETFAGRPEAQLQGITGQPAPRTASREWHNKAPNLAALRAMMDPAEGVLPEGDGRWMPFCQGQCATFRERYADDLMWLAAGADGLARLIGDPAPEKAGQNLPIPDMTRGRDDERRHIKVARAGRKGTARQAG
ncbi:hypothetical protein [Aestuariivita sp.]|jgi:hypothetical protein|uniref:hypothetical protein n=1 Tax=Aestuariivita sp. TaxID=1872407 RepID=UPI0025BD9343|nr:hypothetical protein [Aestuariivita sp.]